MPRLPRKKKNKTTHAPVAPPVVATRVHWSFVRQTMSAMFAALGDMHELYSCGLDTNTGKRIKCRVLCDLITLAMKIMGHLRIDGASTTYAKVQHNRDRYPVETNKGSSLVDGDTHKVDVVFAGSVPLLDDVPSPEPFLRKDDVLGLTHDALQFSKDRDWDHMDTVKNLLYLLSGEVGELSAALGWIKPGVVTESIPPTKVHDICGEAADVVIYALKLADRLAITADLVSAGCKPDSVRGQGNAAR